MTLSRLAKFASQRPPTQRQVSFFAPPLFAKVSLANRSSAVCVPIPLPSNASNALRWEGLASIRGRVWDDVVLIETVISMNFTHLSVKRHMELFSMAPFQQAFCLQPGAQSHGSVEVLWSAAVGPAILVKVFLFSARCFWLADFLLLRSRRNGMHTAECVVYPYSSLILASLGHGEKMTMTIDGHARSVPRPPSARGECC